MLLLGKANIINMVTKIYYFSGTGNSLFIAKKLHEALEDSELIPIIQALKEKDRKIIAHKVVLVFPVYALTIPLPVRDFLKKFDFKDVSYFSAIATRLGLFFDDFKRIEKYTKPKKLNSHFIINMGNNDVKQKNYQCPTIDVINKLESAAIKKLEIINNIITSEKNYFEQDSTYLEPPSFGNFRDKLVWWLVPKMMTFSKLIGGVNYFYTNSNCNGCGLCARICLSGKISMNDNTPVWNKKILCHMCYACVNFCPKRAIEIDSIPGVSSYSYENERYSHPYAELKDIQNQKCEH